MDKISHNANDGQSCIIIIVSPSNEMLWKTDGIFLIDKLLQEMVKFQNTKSILLSSPSLFVTAESRQTCCHNRTVLEKILTFGRELQNMSIQLRREHGKNETNKKALQVSQSQSTVSS